MKDHEKDLPVCIVTEFYGRGLTAKHLTKNVKKTKDTQHNTQQGEPANEDEDEDEDVNEGAEPTIITPVTPVTPIIPNIVTTTANDTDGKTKAVTLSNLPQQISRISKFITDDSKYNGMNAALDHKMHVFKGICEMFDLPASDYRKAMRLTLKGPALDHYHEHENVTTFESMVASLRKAFEGPDFQRSQLAKWNTITYQKIRLEHPDMSASQCIDTLTNELYHTRRNLDDAFKSDTIMYTRIIDACTGSKECHAAIANPPRELPVLINNLKSCVTSYIATFGDPFTTSTMHVTDATDDTADTYLTDRRYNRNYSSNRFGRFNRPNNRNDNRFGRFNKRPDGDTSRNDRNSRSCYVCKKPNCWSTKHTQKERDDARDRYYNRARQYVADMLDDDDKSDGSNDIEQFMNDFDLDTE